MGATSESRAAKNRETLRRWYEGNHEQHNKNRRKKYAEDPALRAKARENAAKQREARKNGKPVERMLTRDLNGIKVKVLTTGAVADILGRTPQMIRNWELKGWIPKPVFEESHRWYTRYQVELMKVLCNVVDTYRYDKEQFQGKLNEAVEFIASNWKN